MGIFSRKPKPPDDPYFYQLWENIAPSKYKISEDEASLEKIHREGGPKLERAKRDLTTLKRAFKKSLF